jgi:outer membrane protein OmpA-like peptidoglycan-associated protein
LQRDNIQRVTLHGILTVRYSFVVLLSEKPAAAGHNRYHYMMTFGIRSISLTLLFLCTFFSVSVFAQADSSRRIGARGYSDTHFEELKNVNSGSDDAAPFISPDEGTLYFSSYRNGKEMIFRSKRASLSEWAAPEVFVELPGREKIGGLSIAADGKTCVFNCSDREDCLFNTTDIFEGQLENGELKNIHSLGKDINSEWWDAQPCISRDGQLLFFVSDRKHGIGKWDIYMCTRNSSGGWSAPVDLSFNKSGEKQISPFIASDNQTLYFAANYDGGQGEFDIYVTYRKGENEWSEPKNLGPAVNSKSDEAFFFIPPTEDAVYLSSTRSNGNLDLYRVIPNIIPPKPKFIAFRGQVLDAETGKPVRNEPDTKLEVSQNSEPITNTGSARNYSAMAPIGKMIRVSAGADGYVNGTIEVQTPSAFDSAGFSQDIKLVPAKVRIVGHVTNAFTGKSLAAEVILKEDGGSAKSAQTDASGSPFTFDAKVFSTYTISCNLKDYEPYESPVIIPQKREALITVTKEIRMTPAGIPPVMVNFDYNKWDLEPAEAKKMSDFIQRVKENPNVKLDISGHTDEHGTEEFNLALSSKRAKTVVDYLESQGVAKDQVAIVTGKGKSAPLVKETDEAARRKNRRVEIHIVGKE